MPVYKSRPSSVGRAAKQPAAAASKQLKEETTKQQIYSLKEASSQLKMQAAFNLLAILSLCELGAIQAAPVSSGKCGYQSCAKL